MAKKKKEAIVLTIPDDVAPKNPKPVTCCEKCQRERDHKHGCSRH